MENRESGRTTRKNRGAMMCYDENGRIEGTCACDRPYPKITVRLCSTTYEYPYLEPRGDGNYYWAFVSDKKYAAKYRVLLGSGWTCSKCCSFVSTGQEHSCQSDNTDYGVLVRIPGVQEEKQ